MWTCCSLRETLVVLPYAAADLQPLVKGIRLRRRYNNSLSRVSVGNRFNRPHPIEASIPIVVPASATALRYLYAPKIVIGWNCENKCNCSRHDHSAQNTNEKYPNHLVFPHFPHSISKVAVRQVLYLGAINPKRLWCAIIAASLAESPVIRKEFRLDQFKAQDSSRGELVSARSRNNLLQTATSVFEINLIRFFCWC
jgi:hypothetical protein